MATRTMANPRGLSTLALARSRFGGSTASKPATSASQLTRGAQLSTAFALPSAPRTTTSGAGATAHQSKPPGTVDPFLTPDQIFALENGTSDILSQGREGDISVQELGALTALERTKIEDQRARNADAATDAMIARGLYRSSIREHELNDIDKAAQQRQDSLTTTLATAAARNVRLHQELESKAKSLSDLTHRQMVANAQAIEPPVQLPTPGVRQHVGSTPAVSRPTANTTRPASTGPTRTMANPRGLSTIALARSRFAGAAATVRRPRPSAVAPG